VTSSPRPPRFLSSPVPRLVESSPSSLTKLEPTLQKPPCLRNPVKLVEFRGRVSSPESPVRSRGTRVSLERNNNNITISLVSRERFTRNSRRNLEHFGCHFDIGNIYFVSSNVRMLHDSATSSDESIFRSRLIFETKRNRFSTSVPSVRRKSSIAIWRVRQHEYESLTRFIVKAPL